MTFPNFKESHPAKPWYPNLAGHQQKEKHKLQKIVINDIEARTRAIQDEIFNKKTETTTDTTLSNP